MSYATERGLLDLDTTEVDKWIGVPLGGQQPTFMQPQREAPNADMFPGYPQDMFMVMDEAVAKPETHGLRPGWSGATMGMMTIVRVLKPEMFDKIAELKAEQQRKARG